MFKSKICNKSYSYPGCVFLKRGKEIISHSINTSLETSSMVDHVVDFDHVVQLNEKNKEPLYFNNRLILQYYVAQYTRS